MKRDYVFLVTLVILLAFGLSFFMGRSVYSLWLTPVPKELVRTVDKQEENKKPEENKETANPEKTQTQNPEEQTAAKKEPANPKEETSAKTSEKKPVINPEQKTEVVGTTSNDAQNTKTEEKSSTPQNSNIVKPKQVNVNTATKGELMTIPGMTGKLADAMLRWRDKYEFFIGKHDFMMVEGMTEELYDQMAPYFLI